MFSYLLFPFLLILAWQDLKTYHVSLWGLLGALGVSLTHFINSPHKVSFLLSGGILLLSFESLRLFFRIFIKKEALGQGDSVLAFILGLWLTLDQVPLFMVVAGVLGILAALLFHLKKIPFAAVMVLSFYWVHLVSLLTP